MREMVRSYFAKALSGYTKRLNDTGWPDDQLEMLKGELDVHKEGISGFDDLSDLYLDGWLIEGFLKHSGLSETEWAENEPDLRREIRKGRRDQIKAFLSLVEGLDSYSFGRPSETPSAPPQAHSATLGEAYNDFMAEHTPGWSDQMVGKAEGFLAVLLEYFGKDRHMAEITRQDANALKKVVQTLPVNRKIKPELKSLSLAEAIKVEGMKKVSIETVNNHLAMFFRLWEWSVRHDYAPDKLFESMKVSKPKKAMGGRKAYTKEQTSKLYAELTENHAGLVKKEDHKWGALLAMFTGARLNEIAQLEVGDIGKEGDISFLNITDDGDNKKRVKANASKRRVPIHSELIRLGFLDWVATKTNEPRLFISFSYDVKDGYGRNLGRWFNTRFLVGLGIKEPGLVFHSLRHTMVTRLGQASVSEPLYQEIVGHERQGVAQQIYFKEGHTLAQKQEAIEKFEF